ncbi:hypothetical protein TSUD_239030 [Trifolium subterraneum]|uniref:Uncharacterized protein n=1 Tax=Trifolium subterraneum TaxID=3900 RepID=A0A2Z6PC59_TRISU|nr:hypothetical protein TSUD_239030 [Trifolium subterraneum]
MGVKVKVIKINPSVELDARVKLNKIDGNWNFLLGDIATSYESEGNDALPGSVAIMFTVAAVSEQGKCSLALEYETQEVQIPIEIPLSSFLSPLPPLHLVIPVKGVTKGIAEVGGRSLTIAGGYEQESY